MTTIARECLITQLLEVVTPMVHNFARNWHLDFDDLYQDSCIHIIRLVDAGQGTPPNAMNRVRCRLLNTVTYMSYRRALSLDEPLSSDSEVTLMDLIPSPYSHDPASILLTKEKLAHLEAEVMGMRGNHGNAVRDRYQTALATYC